MPEMGEAGALALVWGWDGTDPQRVAAAALGATIASTEYGLATIASVYGYDGANQRRVSALALGATVAVASYGLVTSSILYGYDGTTVSRLLAEDATNPNLRVRLYDGATGIDSQLVDTGMTTERGLAVCAALYGHVAADDIRTIGADIPTYDTMSPSVPMLHVISLLYGFDGTYMERLRTYDTGILKVGRAEVGLLTKIFTAEGAIGAPCKVFWITCASPNSALEIELNDSAADTGTDKWTTVLTNPGVLHAVFDPPIEFATDCFVDLTGLTKRVTVGYLT